MSISRRSNLCVPSWHIHIVPIARHRTRLPCSLPPLAVRRTTDCKHSAMRATSGGLTPTGIQTVMRVCGCATQILRKVRGVWIPTKVTIQHRQQVHRNSQSLPLYTSLQIQKMSCRKSRQTKYTSSVESATTIVTRQVKVPPRAPFRLVEPSYRFTEFVPQ